MKAKTTLISGIIVFLISISASLAFSQEITEEPMVIEGGAIPEPQNVADIQWVWGEVVSVNLENKEIVVKYLDYETDQEREITVNVDENTAYENVKSIEEIKPQDNLSIDYIVSLEGKHIAKNISVEKLESEEVLPAEVTPEVPLEEILPEPKQRQY